MIGTPAYLKTSAVVLSESMRNETRSTNHNHHRAQLLLAATTVGDADEKGSNEKRTSLLSPFLLIATSFFPFLPLLYLHLHRFFALFIFRVYSFSTTHLFKMPRSRGGASRPAPSRPTAPAAPPRSVAPQQQQRPMSTTAQSAPAQQAHPPAQASQGPGLFGQMASTAA